MRIHLIAIGGAVMHNIAMALHNKGFHITGSDDEIFEPSKSRLAAYGLLPKEQGWNPNRITKDLDGVILGMHARKDNPELVRAQELDLKTWSFPEYIYEQSKDKKRVVIGGSHGKTTVTSMIMHALWFNHYSFDYMVGSQVEGFETMVKLSDDAPIIILEGDEYLSSPIDPRPKFHLYKPHVAVLTGIAWDHMNVFPTFENYLEQFRVFASEIETEGKLYWYDKDVNSKDICSTISCKNSSYSAHEYITENGETKLLTEYGRVGVPVFGNHNMQNIAAALLVCEELGMPAEHFYEAISSFKGAARRQQRLAKTDTKEVYLDFAHAPSKVKATLASFRETYPDKKIFAFLELHTFSSLNKEFMPQYAGTLDPADRALVFYNPEVVKHKKLAPIEADFVKACFSNDDLLVINDKDQLQHLLSSMKEDGIYLFMSSGNFSGLNMEEVAAAADEEWT
jgi:UDP-N-acetylmuramate: L-alanyl-gamma-D-glutamyl-meso-diaminopimelate ligase